MANAWCDDHGHCLSSVSGEVLREWVESEIPYTRSPRSHARSALKAFWELTGRRKPPLWAIRVPSKPRGRCRALEEPQAALLARYAEHRAMDGDQRAFAALWGLYAALRRHEIAKLKWSDIGSGWITVVGKGAKTGVLPLHPVLTCISARWERQGSFVFPGRYGGPSSPARIWCWMKELGAEVGLELSPHVLRHTCLTTANELTGDLRAVQELARHERPETTSLYTRVTDRRLSAVVRAIDYGRKPDAESNFDGRDRGFVARGPFVGSPDDDRGNASYGNPRREPGGSRSLSVP